ncbi:MAG: NADH-quinone oxidoreductase subunit J [Zoogloeaceae bacterium]|jgi:NADH-quinone oxidoreductase subunit J|nr:NADH-quinone oxidoreductase subunit J [Zoogloeaceae bacterium]
MDFKTLIFFFLATVLIVASLRVITARNPVYAVLYLILAFFSAAGVWLLLEAEFLAMVLVMVYIGAVMVLFLFVVMMLDLDLDQIREGFWRYLPVGALVGFIIVLEMGAVLAHRVFQEATAISMPGESNTRVLGALLSTDFVYPFELAAVLLLVAVVAAVALTYRGGKAYRGARSIDPSEQLRAQAADRLRIVKMPVTREGDDEEAEVKTEGEQETNAC